MKKFLLSLFNFEEKKDVKRALLLLIILFLTVIMLAAIQGAIAGVVNCKATERCSNEDAEKAGFVAFSILFPIEIALLGIWILIKKKALTKPSYLLLTIFSVLLTFLKMSPLELLPII